MLPLYERNLGGGRRGSLDVSTGGLKSVAGLLTTSHFTACGWVQYTATAADYALCIVENAGVNYSGLGAAFGSDIAIWGGNGSSFTQLLSAYVQNIWYFLAVTTLGATTLGYYRTRTTPFASVSLTATDLGTTTDVVKLSNDAGGSGLAPALFGSWKFFNRPLTQVELYDEALQTAPMNERNCVSFLRCNPGAPFEDARRPGAASWSLQSGTIGRSARAAPVPEIAIPKSFVYLSSGGPAAYTLTAAQGSFTLTGEAAALRAARILTAAQASIAMTGEASTLAVSMPAAAGSFALTGQAANLRAARILPAAQGSLTLTGEAVALETAMPATSGSFALTGEAAALRAARVLAAAEASFNLTGEASAFGATMPAAAGLFVLTGEAASLRAARALTAAQASFALTGEASAFGATMPAAAGLFVLTGEAASLRAARALTAAQASFALTGEASSLGAAMPAAQGSFVLTGNDAVLSHGTPGALAADPGFFTLTGEPAALLAARRLTAAQGSLALSGEAATLAAAMPASSSSFVLTGEPAAFRAARILTASSATIAITGEAATLRVSGAVVDLEPSVALSSSLLVACASSSAPIVSVTLS